MKGLEGIPAPDRSQIEQALRSKKKPVTADNIIKLYQRIHGTVPRVPADENL